MKLNSGQKSAYFEVAGRVQRGYRYSSLTGYAGTGKTFTASQIANDLQRDVIACAPTHKATWVLEQKVDLEVATLHSLLGLAMVPDNKTGEYELTKRGRGLKGKGVVVLDEASMVDEILWRHIEAAENVQWIFVGDLGQLPPVQGDFSPALEVDGGHLDEIVRQKRGNPILTFAKAVREGEDYLSEASYAGDEGVAVTDNEASFTQSALEGFQSADPDEPPPVRVLAYRNRTVQRYNQLLRQLMHGDEDLPEYMPGDWLMLSETFFEDSKAQVKNAEEVKVIKAHKKKMLCVGESWDIWMLTVDRAQIGGKAVLPVLRREEKARYEKKLRKMNKACQERGGGWKDFYRLKEAFARLEYCYSMTCHKSQGSTFHTTYVDHRDLMRCRDPRERRALAYVAVTRPSNRLALLV